VLRIDAKTIAENIPMYGWPESTFTAKFRFALFKRKNASK
jgi:hypothetical protein